MKKLSPTQTQALKKIREYGKFIRWPGGFWTYEAFKPGKAVPEYYCDVRTLRVLKQLEYVDLDERQDVCYLKTE